MPLFVFILAILIILGFGACASGSKISENSHDAYQLYTAAADMFNSADGFSMEHDYSLAIEGFSYHNTLYDNILVTYNRYAKINNSDKEDQLKSRIELEKDGYVGYGDENDEMSNTTS
jgi:hypothetical protein